MSALVIDPMDDATQWSALQVDGVTPSLDLTIADDNLVSGRGSDGVSQRITASSAAMGHVLRRALAPMDISGFSELRLSIRSDRLAVSSYDSFLRLRLASAALPLGSPGNTWHRLLPVATRDRWLTIKLTLDDLPPAISAALSVIQLGCVSGDPPFTVHIDDLTLVRPEMVLDTNRALEARLDGIVLGAGAVSAIVRSAAEPAPGPPALDIVNIDVQYASSRALDVDILRDYTDGGSIRLVPLGEPYDLHYSVTPIATTGDDNARLVDAVLQRIPARDELDIEGDTYPIEAIWLARLDRPVAGGAGPVLFYKVEARNAVVSQQPVRRVDELRLVTDQR